MYFGDNFLVYNTSSNIFIFIIKCEKKNGNHFYIENVSKHRHPLFIGRNKLRISNVQLFTQIKQDEMIKAIAFEKFY